MDLETNDSTRHDSLQPESVRPDSVRGEAEAPAADHVSDPAHSDELGHDWTDEGGATPSGPATEGRAQR